MDQELRESETTCLWDVTAEVWYGSDGTDCPSTPKTTIAEECALNNLDGKYYTVGSYDLETGSGVQCPDADFQWHIECVYRPDTGEYLMEYPDLYNDGDCVDGDRLDKYGDTCSWYAENPSSCGTYDADPFEANEECCGCGGGFSSNPCYYTKTYTFTNTAVDVDGNQYVVDGLTVPETVIYYKVDGAPTYDDYDGYFFPYASEAGDPLHRWIECFYDSSDSLWKGYDPSSQEEVDCPQTVATLTGDDCTLSDDGFSYTIDGEKCPSADWTWKWTCEYDEDSKLWRDPKDSQPCDWSTTYFFVHSESSFGEASVSSYKIYNSDWMMFNLLPMTIRFHHNKDGDCKFSIIEEDDPGDFSHHKFAIDRFGRCFEDDNGVISLIFEANPDVTYTFSDVGSFGWGYHEPSNGPKLEAVDATGTYFLWDYEALATGTYNTDTPEEVTYYSSEGSPSFESYEGYFLGSYVPAVEEEGELGQV